MTIWKSGLPKAPSSPCPPSPWKAMPMARHIRSPAPMPRSFLGNMRTGPSRAASAQPAPGSAAGLCRSSHRNWRKLIDGGWRSEKREHKQESTMTQLESEHTASQNGKVVYTAKTHTTGGRENGASRSSDGRLDVKLSVPGAVRIGTNPEQLFAAGWSACFESAIGLAARKRKITLPADVAIDAEVDLHLADTGYFLITPLNITLPATDPAVPPSLLGATSSARRQRFQVARSCRWRH